MLDGESGLMSERATKLIVLKAGMHTQQEMDTV